MVFLDVLRAIASVVILLHHFANYPPFCDQVAPILGSVVRWFHDYARMTQVFFVVGGFVMAQSLSSLSWDAKGFGVYAIHRYLRLGIPYLVTVALALAACWFGRGWLPEFVVGPPPTLSGLVVHALFLQDLLDMEPFSAGIWFVCINFQLGLCYTALLVVRDRCFPCRGGSMDSSMIAGVLLSAFSLFYFNVGERWDVTALYFFPYFFMGVVVHHSCSKPGRTGWFVFFLMLILAGMAYCWRGRLVGAVVVGLLLFSSVRGGWLWTWPKNRMVEWMGRVSYSLFLVHFPVLVVVSTVWVRMGWESPWQALAGLVVAFVASFFAAAALHRWVEVYAIRVSRRWVVDRRIRTPESVPAVCPPQ